MHSFLSQKQINRIVLLSDGLANIGPDSPEELGQLGADLVDEGISVSTIGLGLGYNEDLMSKLAFKSDGGHYFAENANELASVFDREFDRALSAVAQDVKIEIICSEQIRPVRILGRQGRINGQNISMNIQNIYSQHERYAIVELEVPAFKNDMVCHLSDVRINYHDMPGNKYQKTARSVNISFSDLPAKVENSINKKVLADAIEQIAVENNKRALILRDRGKVEQARRVLFDNTYLLRSNAEILKSEKLNEYAVENDKDADNLDEYNWKHQRKSMRQSQTSRSTQR